MSDILNDVMQAYKDRIETQRQPGMALDFLNSSAIIQSPSILLPDFSIPLPTCLIYVAAEAIDYIYICTNAYEKSFDVALTLIKEGLGAENGIVDNYNEQGILSMGRDLENHFQEETFDLTDQVMISDVSPLKLRMPPFLDTNVNMFTIVFQHKYFQGVL